MATSLILHWVVLELAPAPARAPNPGERAAEHRAHKPEPKARRRAQQQPQELPQPEPRPQAMQVVLVRVDPKPRELQPVPAPAPEPKPEPKPPEPKPPDRWVHFVPLDTPSGRAEDATFVSTVDAEAARNERPRVTASQAGPTLDGMVSRSSGTPSRNRAASRGPSSPGQGEGEPSPREGEQQELATQGPHEERTRPPAHAAPPRPVPRTERKEASQAPLPEPGALAEQRATTQKVALPDGPDAIRARRKPGESMPLGAEAAARVEPTPPEPPLSERQPEQAPPADRLVLAPPGRPDPEAMADAEQTARLTSTDSLKRKATAAGHPTPSRPTEPFAPSFSPQAAFDEPQPVDGVQASARRIEEGGWISEVNALVQARWLETELPLEDRAMGVEGMVIVEFQVARNGRTSEVAVIHASGHAHLDAYAQLAIPARLPKPPHGPVTHRIAFHYLNGAE